MCELYVRVELFKFDCIFVCSDISERSECLGPAARAAREDYVARLTALTREMRPLAHWDFSRAGTGMLMKPNHVKSMSFSALLFAPT